MEYLRSAEIAQFPQKLFVECTFWLPNKVKRILGL